MGCLVLYKEENEGQHPELGTAGEELVASNLYMYFTSQSNPASQVSFSLSLMFQMAELTFVFTVGEFDPYVLQPPRRKTFIVFMY